MPAYEYRTSGVPQAYSAPCLNRASEYAHIFKHAASPYATVCDRAWNMYNLAMPDVLPL
jgi:hypothetical protein